MQKYCIEYIQQIVNLYYINKHQYQKMIIAKKIQDSGLQHFANSDVKILDYLWQLPVYLYDRNQPNVDLS